MQQVDSLLSMGLNERHEADLELQLVVAGRQLESGGVGLGSGRLIAGGFKQYAPQLERGHEVRMPLKETVDKAQSLRPIAMLGRGNSIVHPSNGSRIRGRQGLVARVRGLLRFKKAGSQEHCRPKRARGPGRGTREKVKRSVSKKPAPGVISGTIRRNDQAERSRRLRGDFEGGVGGGPGAVSGPEVEVSGLDRPAMRLRAPEAQLRGVEIEGNGLCLSRR